MRSDSGRPGRPGAALLRALSRVPGVYVPACYDVAYDDDGRLVGVTPRFADTPERVEKRTIADLGAWPYPRQQLVPLIEVVHDRLNVELFRGCTRGCRFCQAGHDHPAGARAPGRPGPHHGRAPAWPAPGTTRWP